MREICDSPAPTKLYRASDSPPTTLSNKKLCSLPWATFRYAATGVNRSAGISMKTGTRFGVVGADTAGSVICADAEVEGYVGSEGGLSVEGEEVDVPNRVIRSWSVGTGSEV